MPQVYATEGVSAICNQETGERWRAVAHFECNAELSADTLVEASQSAETCIATFRVQTPRLW